VRSFVSEVLGQEPAGRVDPMTAVGEGAAIAAAILTGELQTSDYFVSTEHALGTVIANFATRSMTFDEIIPRNHKIPAKETQIYRPVVDDQQSIHVVVMEGDVSKPLDHSDNVCIWETVVQLPEPRPMAEASFELTYEYDVDGIVYVTMKDIERDRIVPPLDRYPIPSSGMTKDPRELVNLADRVRGAIDTGGLPESGPRPGATNGDRQARELVERARSKVIPFLEDTQARAIQELVDAVESAVDGQLEGAKQALEVELRKYSYLL
jgi:molecular chaperone DnaK